LPERPEGCCAQLVPDRFVAPEWATRHVLDQTLDPRLIARRQKYRLIDTEAAVRPTPHVLDHFRFELLLSQVQFEDRVLPGDQQSLHIELRQLHKLALGCPHAAGDQHMQVGMPVQELAVRLNRRDHAGYDIVAPQQPSGFRLQTRPRTGRKLTQQPAIEAGVNSQPLGDGQHDLPVSDRRADIFSNMQRGQQRPLLVARGAGAALLAGEGNEHLVLAVGAANSGEALLQIAALQKGRHRLLDDRPPVTVLGLITLVVDLLEGVEMFIEQAPQVGGLGIARAVERTRLDTSGDLSRNRKWT